MSWRATSWAAEQRTGSPISKLVLLKLADNANDEGACWPSLETIADHTELSRRTVQDHLTRLEGMGLIAVEERKAGSGATLSNLYRLSVPARAGKQKGEGAPAAPQGAPGARADAPDAPGRVQLPAPAKDEPSSEPTIEPHTDALARASEGIRTLGQEDFAAWPAFRSAIANTWPRGFPTDDEIACREQFGIQTRSHHAQDLIDCAELRGRDLSKQSAKRTRSQGDLMFKKPSNWLRSGDWRAYLTAAGEARKTEAEIVSKLGRVLRTLPPEIIDALKKMDFSDDMLAHLDGTMFEPGPPPVIIATTFAAFVVLDKRLFRLQRVLNIPGAADLMIRRVKVEKQA